MTGYTRRTTLKFAAAAAAPLFVPSIGSAQTGARHGMSIFGDLKYPDGFTHFDYVNVNAPKGGTLDFQVPNWAYNQNTQTFNTLQSFVLRGDAPPRMEMTFDSLMVRAVDEPDSVYGRVAESVEISDDGNELRFYLRPAARFHDGSPLTAKDVAFSLNILRKNGHPSMSIPLKELVSAEAVDSHVVVVRLSGDQSRSLKLLLAGLPIFSAAFYDGRDFAATSMEIPLSSGPYRVGEFEAGRYIEYERVVDYWGADLPTVKGLYHFDTIRIDFFKERLAGFEAFKKGEVTYRQEFTSRTWAKSYDFPAIDDGRAKKTYFPAEKVPSFQAWFINTRRKKFSDPRTRLAIGLAFDFEWVNKTMFFDAYSRSASYFEKSQYAANGPPPPEELALLQPHRDQLPEAIFGEPYVPPVSDGSGRDRRQLREAVKLLSEAGWIRKDGKLVSASGEPLTIEFLIRAQVFERVLGSYVGALKSIGIDANIRLVDPAQFRKRQDDFDFDIVGSAFSFGATPMEGLKNFFTTQSADTKGSRNYSGIRSPVVDALIDRVLEADNREAHRTAMRALDRVLRAGHYIVPNWFAANHRVAHWDIFGQPDIKPDYAFPVESTWWYDSEKAARIGKSE